MTLTSEQLQALRAKAEAATQPLPWVVVVQDGNATVLDDNGMWVADYGAAPQDAVYGAEAANMVPVLIRQFTEAVTLLAKATHGGNITNVDWTRISALIKAAGVEP